VKIFISYRRADTRALSGRVADRLRGHPRLGDVFFDVSSIEAGTSFVAEIQRSLKRDPVCLVMIGSAWQGPRPDGTARIDDTADIVRAEVLAALERGLRVIPVLVDDTPMPRPEALPEPLRPLSALSAVALRHDSFEQDMDRLIDAILRRRRAGALARLRADHPEIAAALHATGGMILAVLALLTVAIVHQAVFGRSLDETLGGAGPVWMLIAAVLAAGVLLGFLLGRRPL
jgi:hypothetical protein